MKERRASVTICAVEHMLGASVRDEMPFLLVNIVKVESSMACGGLRLALHGGLLLVVNLFYGSFFRGS